MGHFTDEAAFRCIANKIADNDMTRRNSCAADQGLPFDFECRDRRANRETGAHGQFSIVLMCRRIPEINEDGISNVFAYESLKLPDNPGDATLVSADRLAPIFEIAAGPNQFT